MYSKDRLRRECMRLISSETIHESFELIDIYSEFLFLAVRNHHHEAVYSEPDANAKIILQMMLTKILHLKSVVNGITYISKDGATLNEIIDPTVVASLIRNIYETTAMFNLIYRSTNKEEEKLLLHLLWVSAGLQYRQRFESAIITAENREKFEQEQREIEHIVDKIQNLDLFRKLDPKNQGKVQTKIKEKSYLMRFENDQVEFLTWQDLTKVMGIREGLMDNIYTYFSLFAHPSYVAVFQFRDMFNKADQAYLKLTNINLKEAFCFFSIFIADYIKVFPSVLNSFNGLELRDQIVIDFYNNLMRGREYSINKTFEILD